MIRTTLNKSPTSTAYTNLHCRTVEKVLSEAVDSTFKDEPDNPLEHLGNILLAKSKEHGNTTDKLKEALKKAKSAKSPAPKASDEKDPDSEFLESFGVVNLLGPREAGHVL